jgi:hypothetical protein
MTTAGGEANPIPPGGILSETLQCSINLSHRELESPPRTQRFVLVAALDAYDWFCCPQNSALTRV